VFRSQVRKHYTAQRGHRAKKATRRPATTPAMMNAEEALDVARRKYPNIADPSPDTMTAQEAARFLGCSDSNVRLLYHSGKLPAPTQQLRRFGRSGRFHPAMVLPRQAVEAYKAQPESGTKSATPAKRRKKNGAVKRSEYKSLMKSRRERSAKLLARFDRHESRPIPPDTNSHGLSVLVQHGYLKPQGSGYLRTAKEFAV
jgi:excisionase family DNA binding protein